MAFCRAQKTSAFGISSIFFLQSSSKCSSGCSSRCHILTTTVRTMNILLKQVQLLNVPLLITKHESAILQEGEIGHPVSVLLGHTGPASFLDFHKVIPDILLSSSFDGTCRLWSAAAGGGCLFKLQAAASQIQAATLSHNLRRLAALQEQIDRTAVPSEQAEESQSGSDNLMETSASEAEQTPAKVCSSSQCHHDLELWKYHLHLWPAEISASSQGASYVHL